MADSGTPKAPVAFAWHAHTIDECLHAAELESSETGLTAAEAEKRLKDHGKNAMTPPERPSFLRKLWGQINSALIWILIAAAIISGAQQEVVIINVSIGMIQEGKAEKAADALKDMLAPHCTVIRGGAKSQIDADQLVVGDMVFVMSGDKIPADLRLISCTGLKVLESMLTGESMAVTKHTKPVEDKAGVGDRKNMAFSATLVQEGQGFGLVVATGDHTAIGSINSLVQNEDEKPTSLQVQLELFGRTITMITLAIGIAAFFLAFFYTKSGWAEAFRASVAIAVAIIPEGLPAVVTITMSLGVASMASKMAIVRKLPAVETLGSVSTVCSDKTGTLTKNEMTAVAFVTMVAHYPVQGVGYDPNAGKVVSPEGGAPLPPAQEARLRAMMLSAVLPNDGGLSAKPGGGWGISGDPTDVAPLVLFQKAGGDYKGAQAEAKKLAVVPFESEHKWQAVLVQDDSVAGKRVLHLKGAPERLLPLCRASVAGDDVSSPGEPIDAALWEAKAAEMSGKGLRVLACARWEPPAGWSQEELSVPWVASGNGAFLTLVGLIAILDPPRPECIEAIHRFHDAGIVCKMITGDHPRTALAIGVALGLAEKDGRVLTGPQVDALSEEELKRDVLTCNVYARASPDNKIRIVKALQANGQIVSMTGDGVNDAPSLKAANIGVAMGITGTDVSKEAAKIVLQDDNFGTIAEAVREGRRVWDNLKKVFLFNLPTNFAQGLVVFFSFVLGMKEAPLTPIQVLYVNMIISVTMGGALSFEMEEKGIMERKPRRSNEPLVDSKIMFRTLWCTATMVVAIIGVFQWSLSVGFVVGQARAHAFTLLVITSVLYGLNCRSSSEFALGPSLLRPNVAFWCSFVAVPALQAILVHVAAINQFFSCESHDIKEGHCAPLGKVEWGLIIAVSLLIFILVELEKAFILPLMSGAELHVPCFFHHAEGEEEKFKFLATASSFHGVAHLNKATHAPMKEVDKGRFSSRMLTGKVASMRMAGGGSASGSGGGGRGEAKLEVRSEAATV